MRLLKLRLKNYLNIYNALSLNELTIDFSKCKYNIVTIFGENGSGKSSIINEIHPYFSPSNIWIPDVSVEKSIDFLLEDNTILSINYFGYKAVNTKPKQSRVYIKRIYSDGTTIELNSNGNIASGKDIIGTLLDINDDYIQLSSLSISNKGIANMRPSERKRFLALIINNLDYYAKINKLVSQKFTVVKSFLQNLTVKLADLGDIVLLEKEIARNSEELSNLEVRKRIIIERQSILKSKMQTLDSSGDPVIIYNNKCRLKNSMQEDLNHINLDEISKYDEESLSKMEQDSIKLESKYEILDEQLQDISNKESIIRNTIEESIIKLNSLSDSKLLEDAKSRLNSTKEALSSYIKCFESIGFNEYESITEQEYIIAVDALEKINDHIVSIGNEYPESIRYESAKYIHKEYNVVDYQKIIETHYNIKLANINESIRLQQDLESKSADYDKIPDDCNHMNDCPFIISIVESKNMMMSMESYNQLLAEKDILLSELSDTRDLLYKQEQILKCISDIKFIYNYISSMRKLLLKFPNTKNFLDSESTIIDHIINIRPIKLNLKLYREYTNYITMISSAKNDILQYQDKIDKMTNSNKESMNLQLIIDSKNHELEELTNTKQILLDKLNTIKNDRLYLNQCITNTKRIKESKITYENLTKDLLLLNDELKSLYNQMVEYQSYEKEILSLSTEENDISIAISRLSNEIEQSKYKIVLYSQYKIDYDKYSVILDKLTMVKQDSSVNGIQSEIMNYKISDMLQSINQLAAMMFGSRFELQKFIIDSETFSIPVLDKETNEIRSDISMMSNSQVSQLSMIITFVLLYNSSKNYNIICLDEVDNNLDTDNRLRFFDLINMIMSILHFDQCIMISHNYELDISHCDMIITKLNNRESYSRLLNSGANIISDLMK